MDLSIIILNWNAADDTIRCVRQLSAWQQLRPAIWVIDNNSADKSADLIAAECPDVHLIRCPTNLGFAGGTNQGIKASLARGDQPILLLNNDASIGEEDVIRLLKTLHENPDFGTVGPLLFEAEEKDRLLSAGGKNPVLHHQTRVMRFSSDRPLQAVENISGTAILIRADVFRQVGLLDEAYFFSTELADLCARARQQGYLSVINTQAHAFHRLSRSAHFRSNLYPYYITRNRFIYIRKFYGPGFKSLLLGFWGAYGLLLSLKLYLNGQRSTACAVRLGLVDGWQGRFYGQNERVLAVCPLSPPRSPPRGGREAG